MVVFVVIRNLLAVRVSEGGAGMLFAANNVIGLSRRVVKRRDSNRLVATIDLENTYVSQRVNNEKKCDQTRKLVAPFFL